MNRTREPIRMVIPNEPFRSWNEARYLHIAKHAPVRSVRETAEAYLAAYRAQRRRDQTEG